MLVKVLGLTLLETLFALAIGALVLVGGLVFYTSTNQSSNVRQTVTDMNAIVTAYKAYALGNNITADTSIATLQDNKLLPNPFINPWGAAYVAAITLATGTTPTTVTIHIVNIRGIGQSGGDADCSAIAQAAQPTGRSCNNDGCAPSGLAGCYFQYTL